MEFKRLADYFQRLEKTSSRLEITRLLVSLFKEAKSSEIAKICYLSLGQLAPSYEGIEFNLAEKMMIRVLACVLDKSEEKIRTEFKRLGDFGEVIYGTNNKPASAKASAGGQQTTKSLSVEEVYQRLMVLAKEQGTGSVEKKIQQMAELILDLDNLSAKYVVRIPVGKLRLGFSDLTILDALSWISVGDKSKRDEIEAAFNVRADIGEIAQITKSKGFAGLKGIKIALGTPVMPALSGRLPTAEEMIKKVATTEGKVAVEPKYDGTRLQVHFKRDKKFPVRIFTRNLENVTQMFPDIIEALSREVRAKEVILDGEAIGFDPKTGKFLPFQETIKRKRKYEVVDKAKEIPLRFFVFDILYRDGVDLLHLPFSRRRQVLEEVLSLSGKTILISPQIIASSASDLRVYHDEQIKKGLEGAMVKMLDAPYEPGRRGFAWVKFKSEKGKKGAGLTDTLDCVVMGYNRGKGKRASFGIGAFLVGVRVGEKFLTVSKIGTGLTDEQWRELKTRSGKWEVDSQPKEYEANKNLAVDVWVSPKIVVEIEADNITKSPIHTAGFAFRFPRLVRFRDDKSPEQATTLSELKKLYELQ